MANKVNKVIDRNGNTLIDLTNDTVTPSKVLSGTKFHGADGREYIGSLQPNELDILKYNFIDYDGTLMYSFTDDELDALTELPAGPDHTDDNLTFQEWNWTLEDLKAWDRTRITRPIVGANLITTDGKSYIYLDSPISDGVLTFSTNGTLASVDWGDGTVDTNNSHTYAAPGEYIVVIDMADGYWFFGWDSQTNTSLRQWIKSIKLGNIPELNNYALTSCYSMSTVSIPSNIKTIDSSSFYTCPKLENIVIPNGVTKIGAGSMDSCYSLKSISIPNSLESFEDNVLQSCYSLKDIVIPGNVKNIGSSVFRYCYNLTSIEIPNSVTTIGSSLFNNCYSLKNVILSNNIAEIKASTFTNCYSLVSIEIPNLVTTIGQKAFSYCKCLETITIPDSVTSIGNTVFSEDTHLTLDLSKQTKVITLTGSIGNFYFSTGQKILVPVSLLEQYKSASYWSNYASVMVGV